MDLTTRLSKAKIGFSGLLESICGRLDEWRPPALSTEAAYSNMLATLLRERLPEDSRVEREYLVGETDPALLGRLEDHLKQYEDSFAADGCRIVVVT
jgi:hypothetical protein